MTTATAETNDALEQVNHADAEQRMLLSGDLGAIAMGISTERAKLRALLARVRRVKVSETIDDITACNEAIKGLDTAIVRLNERFGI